MATTLKAIPDPRSANAPYFSDQPNEPIALPTRVDALAISCGLTDAQKGGAILEYVSPSVRDFWKTLDGFGTGDWQTF
ncbi:hypothetical protein BGY98DRAFT_986791, partial [Russula aff. rugulosa BPL654]